MSPGLAAGDLAAGAVLGEQAVGAVERRPVVHHREAVAVVTRIGVDEEAVGRIVPGPEVLHLQAVDVDGVDAVLGGGTSNSGVLPVENGLLRRLGAGDDEVVVLVAAEDDALVVGPGLDLDDRLLALVDLVHGLLDRAVLAAVLTDLEHVALRR